MVSQYAMEGVTEDFIPDIDMKIISREKWGALPPKSTEPLPLPAERIFFMFTDTKRCESKKDCVKTLLDMQKHYMTIGMPDLPFSFLIGGDLRIYEGRGWGVKISRSDVKYWNDERVVIGYMCPQKQDDDRTGNMIRKGYQVMYYGIRNSYLRDFDKRDDDRINVEDSSEILRKYYEDRMKKEEKEKEKAERKEQRRKDREEAKGKTAESETKEEVKNEQSINIEGANINIEEVTI